MRRYFAFVFMILTLSTAAQTSHWQQLSGPFGGPVEALAELADATLLAGQGLGGLWRSTDGGSSWERTSTDDRLGNFPSIIPSDGSTVYAGCFSGLFISNDAGRNWSLVHSGFPVWTLATGPNGRLYAGSIGTVWRSQDGGQNWEDLHPADNSSSVFRLVRGESGMLFAGSYRHGLQRSSNDGSSWELISNKLPSHQIWTVHMFRGRELYVGSSAGVFCSSDGGYTWKDRSTGLDTAIVTQISLHGNSLFALSTDNRIFTTDDQDGTWSAVEGPGKGTIFHVAATDNALWVGTEQGLHFSADGGLTWTPSASGMYHPAVGAVATSGPSTLFAGTDRGGVYRSTDAGSSWSLSTSGISGSFEARSISASGQSVFAASYEAPLLHSGDGGGSWKALTLPGDPAVITVRHGYAGVFAGSTDGQVFHSTNDGASWTALAAIDNNGQAPSVEAIFVQSGVIYAGTSLGLYRTTDAGTSWVNTCPALKRSIIRVLSGIADGSVVFAGDYTDLYRSIDSGETWTAVLHESGQGFLQSIAVNSGKAYLSNTDGAVYESRDGGAHWSNIGPVREGEAVLSMAFDDAGMLLAGTDHHGVLRSGRPAATDEIARQPSGFLVEQHYPNPFGAGTGTATARVRFTVERPTSLVLQVYDLIGRVIMTRTLGQFVQGSHDISLDASGMTPGVYYYSLSSEGTTLTRSMIIR